jgi:hypothetical protein
MPKKSSTGSTLMQLENTLEMYFGKKAPNLPSNIKELLVNLTPWLVIIGIILTLPALMALFGLGAVAMPFQMMGANFGYAYKLSILVSSITIILELIALPKLFSRKIQGWRLLYYAALISVASNLLTLSIFSALIGGVISFYLLFQIKSYYK